MSHRITAVSFTPSANFSANFPDVTVRGSRSGREIRPGDELTAEDGDLVVTRSCGAVIPTCSVTLTTAGDSELEALASALFGWLP